MGTETDIDINEVLQYAIHYHQNNQLKEALELYNTILLLDENHAIANYNLGLISVQLKNYEISLSFFEKAISLDPSNTEYKETLNTVKTLITENEKALQQIDKQIIFLFNENKLKEAITLIEDTIQKNPNYFFGYKALGSIHSKLGYFNEAVEYFQKAIELKSDDSELYQNLAATFKSLGNFKEAERNYKKALQYDPKNYIAFQNLLFDLNYHPTKSAQEIFKVYQKFEKKYCTSLYKYHKPHKNSKDTNRKLKIGYVSPDFCDHPVKNFFEPLVSNHDKSKFEIYLYAQVKKEDEVTKRYKTYADHWIVINDLDDHALAKKIRDEKIDILVDLAGHTEGNRLLMFALKPAPISYSWLGYGYTTGIKAIDYFLSDEFHIPKGSEKLFSEKPYYIQNPFYIYRPTQNMGEVSSLPYLENKYITFGTLTRSVRINDKVIEAWSKVLKEVPNSKLIINSADFKEDKTITSLEDKFTSFGIEKERLEIGFNSPPWDVLRKIDIGLDCFPHNSGTTLFETLYMGIPYVTLEDRVSVGRLGSSILHGINKPQWVATTVDEYIEKLISLSQNTNELINIRENLRKEMEDSDLMNEPAFALKIENAYHDMFQKWQKK